MEHSVVSAISGHGPYPWQDVAQKPEKGLHCPMQLAAEGITEDNLLRHAVLILEHAFKRIDARPLPGGQATVIVDLAGLALPDLAPLLRLSLLVRPSQLALHAACIFNHACLITTSVHAGIAKQYNPSLLSHHARMQGGCFGSRAPLKAAATHACSSAALSGRTTRRASGRCCCSTPRPASLFCRRCIYCRIMMLVSFPFWLSLVAC